MKIKLLIALVSLCVFCFLTHAQSETKTFLQQKVAYLEMCNSLQRSNIDCACVATSHATYAHLSPSDKYAEYLIESYKENIGQPNIMTEVFNAFAGNKTNQQVQIEIYNAFSEFE